MEGLSHLGVHCTTTRDKVDGSDEQGGRRLGEGFRGSEGRRRGIQSQKRQTTRASEAATADDKGFRVRDDRWQGLQMQRWQTRNKGKSKNDISMEGLSHLGVQCTMVRDKVDDSDEQRRGLHRQQRQRVKASEEATADGEGFKGSDDRRRGLRR
ncbi:hypothetical protein Scep_004081 [Stephania cephalantha]|uniref:Uncharacterized protein n=1 Tax=Stephania cephalantha TaxID=152367 RepID=A0AAP0PV12_9MAGN